MTRKPTKRTPRKTPLAWPRDYMPEQDWLARAAKRVQHIRQKMLGMGYAETDALGVWRRPV